MALTASKFALLFRRHDKCRNFQEIRVHRSGTRRLNQYKPYILFMVHRQTVQTQILCSKMCCLIGLCTGSLIISETGLLGSIYTVLNVCVSNKNIDRYFKKVCTVSYCPKFPSIIYSIFMPPKELWEAYSNRTVRPSVRQSVRPAFVSGPYLLYSLK